MKDCRLSERQSRFAQENHSILESFLDKKGLSSNEYYDIVVFGFLEAVRRYDEYEALRRFEFAKIADALMRTALENHLKREQAQRKEVVLVSLDYRLPNSGLTYADLIADRSVNICEQICEKHSSFKVKNGLSYKYPIDGIIDAVMREVI